MAKKEEEDKTPYITKHKKLYQSATKLLDTISHAHTEAYVTAVNKHLLDENGQVIYDKLLDNTIQQQFTKTMSDFYLGKAQKHFKIEKNLDDLSKDLLMQAYAGVTSSTLKDLVTRYNKRLTHQQFEQVKGQIQQRISQQLYGAAGSHLETSNIPDIVKHVGLEAKVNSDKLDIEEARQLLQVFHEEGSITDNTLRQILPSYKIGSKKKEERK